MRRSSNSAPELSRHIAAVNRSTMSAASAHYSAPTAGGKSITTPPAEPEPSPVSYFGLWRFATWLDVLFAVLGFIAGVGNGIVFPLFTLVRSETQRQS